MNRFTLITFLAVLCSCKVYKQDIMFKFDDEFTKDDLSQVTAELDKNYILQPNDALLLDVFTNDGERLIDPNQEFLGNAGQQQQQMQQIRDLFFYTIQADGSVAFPMIGDIQLAGLTMFEAERLLAKEYNDVYKNTFIKLRMMNRRVFVLGAPGGRVVLLPHENMSIIEILAASEGLDLGAKAQNIKLIRGDDVFLINLSTISGMKATSMLVSPGDVIYVEPWRRPWLETLRDVSPALSLISSVLTLIVVVQNL